MNKVTWKEASKRPKFNDIYVSELPGRFSQWTSISNHKQLSSNRSLVLFDVIEW